MGDFTFNRGDLNTIMLTVLTLANTLPLYPDRYTMPTVGITHVNGGGEIVDLAPINMVQLSNTNRWYYKYSIPILASYTRYLATFFVTIDGVATISTEEFRVVPASASSGSGEFEIAIIVNNSITLQPIHEATVNIYDKNNPTIVLATDQTGPDGKAIFFLSAGTYLAEFNKTGVISEVHTMVVDSLGNFLIRAFIEIFSFLSRFETDNENRKDLWKGFGTKG